MAILIGRGEDCQQKQKLTDMSISRKHAWLEKIGENRWRIRDNGSSFGTFVNGVQIVETEVGLNTPIVLGNFATTVSELLTGVESKEDPSGERVAIDELFRVFEEYQDRMKSLAKKKNKQQLYRMLPMQLVMPLALGVSCMFLNNTPEQQLVKGVIMVSVMGLTGFMSLRVIHNVDDQTDEQYDIVQQFQIDYTCPKCKNFLGMSTPYKALLRRGKCPYCKSEFYERYRH